MPAEPTRPTKKFSWTLALFLIFVAALVFLGFLFWRLETWPMRNARQGTAEMERLGRKARDAFVELAQLQPRVTINNRVYFEQTSGVAELAILSRQTEVEHEFTHTWAGSTKRIKFHGSFDVKAGFDLRQHLQVDVRENEVVINLPHAKILSIEQKEVDVQEFENGYWNKISPADLQKELGALPDLARAKATQSELTAEAEIALRKQLQDRLGTERPVRLNFTTVQAIKP